MLNFATKNLFLQCIHESGYNWWIVKELPCNLLFVPLPPRLSNSKVTSFCSFHPTNQAIGLLDVALRAPNLKKSHTSRMAVRTSGHSVHCGQDTFVGLKHHPRNAKLVNSTDRTACASMQYNGACKICQGRQNFMASYAHTSTSAHLTSTDLKRFLIGCLVCERTSHRTSDCHSPTGNTF